MTLGPSPFVRFRGWLNHALEHLPMANAMALASVTPDGVPSLRTVLLKAYSDDGFVFLNGLRRLFGGPSEPDAGPSPFCSFLVSPVTVR